jgi:hypothetical protein
MTDPLSISVSIIALLQASEAVLKYVRSVKNAGGDTKSLQMEIIHVRSLLYSLKDLLPEPDSGEEVMPVFRSLGGRDGPLAQFQITLEEIAAPLRPKDGLKKVGQAITWPFKKGDIRDLLGKIERYKTLFTLALQNDQLSVFTGPSCLLV